MVFDECALDKSSFLERLFFSWITPILKIGASKPLEINDLGDLPQKLKMGEILISVDKAWNEEKDTSKTPRFGICLVQIHLLLSLIFLQYVVENVLFKLYWHLPVVSFLWCLPYNAIILLQPYAVAALLLYISGVPVEFLGISSGYGIAVFLGAISIIAGIFNFQIAFSLYKL